MTKAKRNNTEDFKIPARFILIILLLIIYVIYVYVVGWTKALLYYTYFLLFLLFFNIYIYIPKNTENLSRYHHNKCNNIKNEIAKLKSEYERCICGKKISSNICKTGSFEYNSNLLANDSDHNYIHLNKFDNHYALKNLKFPPSN